jgi:hypothetical protein
MNEKLDRQDSIDPLLIAVGKMYKFDMWSSNKGNDQLFLWLWGVTMEPVLSSGFVDLTGTPSGKGSRPRLIGCEAKKRG